jgi:hypothetical protein
LGLISWCVVAYWFGGWWLQGMISFGTMVWCVVVHSVEIYGLMVGVLWLIEKVFCGTMLWCALDQEYGVRWLSSRTEISIVLGSLVNKMHQVETKQVPKLQFLSDPSS